MRWIGLVADNLLKAVSGLPENWDASRLFGSLVRVGVWIETNDVELRRIRAGKGLGAAGECSEIPMHRCWEPVRTAFLIAAVMGMRRSEIFGLKWNDVDFDRAILHVRRLFVDGVVGPPKTYASRRPLPIPPPALEALKAWREKSSYTASDNWVFASDISFGKQPLWPELSGSGT
jgi:hypothetical protein